MANVFLWGIRLTPCDGSRARSARATSEVFLCKAILRQAQDDEFLGGLKLNPCRVLSYSVNLEN